MEVVYVGSALSNIVQVRLQRRVLEKFVSHMGQVDAHNGKGVPEFGMM